MGEIDSKEVVNEYLYVVSCNLFYLFEQENNIEYKNLIDKIEAIHKEFEKITQGESK